MDAKEGRRIVLRILGCLVAYACFTSFVKGGPPYHGKFVEWTPPHWTILLVWLPTIAAFWAEGPVYIILLVFASGVVCILSYIVAELLEHFFAFVITGDWYAPSEEPFSRLVFLLSGPLSFLWGIFSNAGLSSQHLRGLRAWVEERSRSPWWNIASFIVGVLGLLSTIRSCTLHEYCGHKGPFLPRRPR